MVFYVSNLDLWREIEFIPIYKTNDFMLYNRRKLLCVNIYVVQRFRKKIKKKDKTVLRNNNR